MFAIEPSLAVTVTVTGLVELLDRQRGAGQHGREVVGRGRHQQAGGCRAAGLEQSILAFGRLAERHSRELRGIDDHVAGTACLAACQRQAIRVARSVGDDARGDSGPEFVYVVLQVAQRVGALDL